MGDNRTLKASREGQENMKNIWGEYTSFVKIYNDEEMTV
jgi:hypothetical protein